MKLKFILSSTLIAGLAFSAAADGYLDGVEYFQVGQDENAKIVLDQTLNDASTNKAEAYYYLGCIALNSGDKAQAQKYFDLGVQSNANYAFNYVGKGKLALLGNDAKAAKGFFGQAEGFDKKNVPVKIGIARAYYDVDSVLYKKEFNNYLKDAKKKDKTNGVIYIFEGDMFRDQKDYGKSAGYYEMAINYDAENPIPYVKYASTYFHIAPDVAISKLKEIADRKPNSLLSQRELAEKYYENGQWTKAAEQYGKVMENANHFDSDESRYVVLLYFGERYDESLALANEVLAKGNSPFLMKRMIFLNKAALKNWEEAEVAGVDFFNTPLEAHYTFTANDYSTYADVLVNLKRHLEAAAEFEKVIGLDASRTDIYRNISAAYSNAAAADRHPELYLKAAEAYQKFIDAGEYGESYKVSDLFTLSARYLNVIATNQDPAVKENAYNKGLEAINTVLEKADPNYTIMQRKARIIRGFTGEENKTKECCDAYIATVDIAKAQEGLAEAKLNAVVNEAYTYVGLYYVQEKDVDTAKKYLEQAYTANPSPEFRSYIDGLK